MTSPFFALHRGLFREGPGEPADIRWAAEVVGLGRDARICDVACGPGADIPTFLAVAPDAKITAVDKQQHFIDELKARIGANEQVFAYAGDMAKLEGPFDLIWCAGAVYFLGIEQALRSWRDALAEDNGAVVFSEPCYFTNQPSAAAQAYWGGHRARTVAEIAAEVDGAGYHSFATRRLADPAWAAYHGPMQERINALRPDADAELLAVLDAAQAEIDDWPAVKDETGYLLSVVRPH